MGNTSVFVHLEEAQTFSAVDVLAENLQRAIDDANDGKGISQNALAKLAGVSQTSVGYMLNPKSRPKGRKGRRPSPTIEQVERVARALHLEAWQLVHPNPSEAPLDPRQRRLFDSLRANMAWLKGRQHPKPAK